MSFFHVSSTFRMKTGLIHALLFCFIIFLTLMFALLSFLTEETLFNALGLTFLGTHD